MREPLDLSTVPTKTIRARHGVTVAYNLLGQGPQTLVLANGLGGRLYAWEPLVRALVPRYRVVTWDYRGLFDSSAPPRRRHLSVPDHAEDAMAILDAEGISRATFCGWSMGVQVSLEAATLYPERIAGLVLLNGTYGHAFSSGLQPFFRMPFASAWFHAVIDYLIDNPVAAPRLAWLSRYILEPSVRMLAMLSGAEAAALRPLMERYMREVLNPSTFTNYLRLFQELDAHSVYHHLRDIEAPALVVSGAWDWLTPAYQSREIASRLRDAEAIHLRRASHFVLLERPDVVVPAITRFLERRARW
jgi:pimeloyl-ACP methyl ester carboxylesterase